MAEGETVTTEPRGKVLVVVRLSICRPGCVAGVARVETDSPHERGEVYSTNSDSFVLPFNPLSRPLKVIIALRL